MKVEKKGKEAEAPQSNLWRDILREAMTSKDLEESHLFFFGDKNTGKKAIVKAINKEFLQKYDYEEKKLNNDEIEGKYSLVDYTHINVKKLSELDGDPIGKINVWYANEMLDKETFETVFKPEYILKAVLIIVVDLSRPWEIMENLKKWCSYVYEMFSNLILKFPFEKQQELRDKVEHFMKLYEDIQFDEEENVKNEPLSDEQIKLRKDMPLKEGVLRTNIGIPMLFVVNKSDIVTGTGEKRRYEEDSEFILKHIRNFALNYGASTIYLSTKQNINLNLFYEYLLHRLYTFDFMFRPNLTDKDSYFVPSGYDSLPVLKGYDANDDLSKVYDERIPPFKSKGAIKEEEIICEDLQKFLEKFRKDSNVPIVRDKQKVSINQLVSNINTAGAYDSNSYGSNYTTNPKSEVDLSKTIHNRVNSGKPNFEELLKRNDGGSTLIANEYSSNTITKPTSISPVKSNLDKIDDLKKKAADKLNINPAAAGGKTADLQKRIDQLRSIKKKPADEAK